VSLSLGFHGGAGTVTGSRFLVEAGPGRVLVDCGLFQGLKDLRLRNWQPPAFDPRSVDAVLLTHAHIDHSGYLPRLVREGFRGPIYTTEATAELAEILLLDAARLQEEDADYANKRGFSKHRPALPLFTEHDAQAALQHLKPVRFNTWLEVPGMWARFHSAGHILGSATVEVRVSQPALTTTIAFSGDLGRYGAPLHADPEPRPECDTLVLESTYGDREHDPEPLDSQLCRVLAPALKRGGIVLIPAFAVARAQLLLLLLRELMESGRLQNVPVDLDSPMAVDATRIYSHHRGQTGLDPERRSTRSAGHHVEVQFHRSVAESKSLNAKTGPRVIISASGMLTGGRVLHHLERLAGDARNLIVLAGYQAAGTRGRALEDGVRVLRMHGQDVHVRARVVALHGFSAHADRGELVRWATAGTRPETVFLVHGEPEASKALEAPLQAAGAKTIIPALNSRYEFVPGSRRWRLRAADDR
jgi:metallo-beta-lactamase family protein